MFDIVFYWLIGGLCAGLALTVWAAWPDMRKDAEYRKKSRGEDYVGKSLDRKLG